MAAEDGGAAGLDGVERPTLDPGQTMRSPIRLAMRAHDIRELQSTPDAGDRRAPWHGAHRLSPAAEAA
jgi:hypothetical protein